MRRASLLFALLLLATPAAAETYVPGQGHVHDVRARPYEPSEARATSPRVYLGFGFDLWTGFETQYNDEPSPDDQPRAYSDIVSYAFALRTDVPVHPLLLLGVQGSFSAGWTTPNEDQLGYSPHVTIDVGVVARLRPLSLGAHGRHEGLISLMLGPTFDLFESAARDYGQTIENEVGLHTAIFGSYQYFPIRSHFGVFVDLGISYHHVPKTFSYSIAGTRSSDDVSYQPIALFGRLGLMLVLFQ